MILNDIWHPFNVNIQSQDTTDYDRKQLSINQAQLYLLQRFIEKKKAPDEFIANPTGLSSNYANNYCPLPSDYLTILQGQLWRIQNDGSYYPFGDKAVITYDDLLIRVGQNWFDNTDIADPMVAAIKEPYIYFDHHLDAFLVTGETITGGTSHATANVESTNIASGTGVGTVSLSAISGTFQIGETIVGTDSATTATVTSQNTQTFTIWNKTGTYQVGETITGGGSLATGTVTSLPAVNKIVLTVTSGTFDLTDVLTGGTSHAISHILTMADNTMGITVVSTSNRVKIGYVKLPTDIVVYDKLATGSITGTFTAGEIVVGGTSNAQATFIQTVTGGIGVLQIYGTFSSSETITGQISGAACAYSGTLTLKPATLQWGVKYKQLLIEACGLMWHRNKNSNEVAQRSDIVDNMIEMMGVTNDNTYAQWSLA